ncbi:MAG TPA: septum formation inhibitor Maf [Firmicutes bacterium]|nr:septum formation inhibitor Maf [Bacillota bacterium]
MKIVLASASPRRAELLKNMGLEFSITPDDSEEISTPGLDPAETVKELARNKASNVAERIRNSGGLGGEEALVIGADTVVVLSGEILGKPKDEADAERTLRRLSGNRHEVYTGVSVIDTFSGREVCDHEATVVEFRDISDEEIAAYIRTGEPMDKAGAYGIQNLGALFVKRIEGDYFNVVGLPLCRLGMILKKEFGVRLIG